MKNSITAALARFVALTNPLDVDVRLIGDSLSDIKGQAQQPMKRAYVRAVFARIEASVFALKQLTLERATLEELSLGERQLLNEKSWRLDEKGKIHDLPMYSSIQQSLRFTLPLLCRVLKLNYEFDTGPGWNALTLSVVVRNRITHPKEPAELEITDKEIQNVKAALEWFDAQWSEIARLHHELALKNAREAGMTEDRIAELAAEAAQAFHDT